MLPLVLSIWQTTAIAVIVVLSIVLFTRNWKSRLNIDGPIGVPIFGYLPFMTSKPHEKFILLSKKYGNVFRIMLGSEETVVLNDWTSIKEAFSKDDFSGRPEKMFLNVFFPNKNLGSLEGPIWKEQRRFALRALRDLGFGKIKMEEHIRDEIIEFMELIDKEHGKPDNLKKLIGGSILNIIAAFVSGKRFNRNDNDFCQIVDALLPERNDAAIAVGAFILFPRISRFFAKYKLFGLHKVREMFKTLREYVLKEVKEHKESYDKTNVRDYIDTFLTEMEQCSDPSSGFCDEVLVGNTIGFFGAGLTTVTDHLSWVFLLLCYHSEYQKKIQEEIDSVIGKLRDPNYSDRNQMLLLQAFILEVQRWTSFVPLNLPRKTLCDTSIQGKRIPKGTQILTNFYAVNLDANLWTDPLKFNPHRFISEDGKSIIKHDALLTFSYGKRSCPGEALATAEIFLFTTFVLQKYDINTVDGGKPSLESTGGGAFAPKTLNLCFTRR